MRGGKKDMKGGTFAWNSFHLNPSPVLPRKALRSGQTQPHTAANFGRKEGLEKVRDDLRGHPRSIVLDRDAGKAACFGVGNGRGDVFFGDVIERGADHDITAVWQGVPSIVDEFGNDFVEIRGIDEKQWKIGVESEFQTDLRGHRGPQFRAETGEVSVQIGRAQVNDALRSAGDELARDRRPALRGIGDFSQRTSEPRVPGSPGEFETAIALNDSQQVVEDMRDPGGNLSARWSRRVIAAHFLAKDAAETMPGNR